MSFVATDRAPTAAERGILTENERREAVRARDKTADGLFVYAVRTTGVYCRPSCGSRPARAENVVFFDTAGAAEAAGIAPAGAAVRTSRARPAGAPPSSPEPAPSSRTPKRRRRSMR